MKLGISYVVFDGEELLQQAIDLIRQEVDFISVIYQTTSYFGNPAHPELISNLKSIKGIDLLTEYKQDLNLLCKDNEVRARNLGLDKSREFGCTHHISADVDEFYNPKQLANIKKNFNSESSVVYLENYYKNPTWMIYPSQNHVVTLIHPVEIDYNKDVKFPYNLDVSRKCNTQNCKLYPKDEFIIHHMTYVRKDIRRKLTNSSNVRPHLIDKAVEEYNNYKLGDKVKLPPDYINRRTVNNEWMISLSIHYQPICV